MSTRSQVASIQAVASIGGAGTMVVELSAVRLLAPWFGSSLVVWTNVIAVILLALAVGYLLGGRQASGSRPLGRMGWVLVGSACLTGWLPAAVPTVGRFFVPAELALDEASGVLLWGSLAASLVLFLLPAVLLGMVAPLAVEAVEQRGHEGAGRAGGRVLCASTLGSLVGVFGTSHVLLPNLGLSGTFLCAGAAMALAGVWALWIERGGQLVKPGVLALVGLGSAGMTGEAAGPILGADRVLLAQVESAYQTVRIVEDRRGPKPLRYLQVNEGFDSFQSVWQTEPGLLPEGYYYNAFALPAFWAQGEGTWRVLVLGLGGGTAFRVLEGMRPDGLDYEFTGVEIDPVVARLAGEHMGLEENGGRLLTRLDARFALRALEGTYDLIILDCYSNQVEIPAHLCTVEFFAEVKERLSPGGWLAANLGGFGFDDPVVDAVCASAASAFGDRVLGMRVPSSRNYILYAREGGELPVSREGRLELPDGDLRRLFGACELEGGIHLWAPGSDAGVRLTDDHAPIEVLQHHSIQEGLRRLAREVGG